MDAITLLKEDHRTVDSLFRRYESGLQGEDKRQVVEEIIRELSIHAAIEEQVLYPAMRRAFPKGEDMAEEGIEEHAEVKETLSDLDGMDPSDPGFDPKVRSLIGDVRHHVEEEEEEMFPKLAGAMSSERLDEMGSALESAKGLAPTRPHPHAPSTPPANIVVGPVAGAVDRTRDAISGRSKPAARKPTAKKPAARKPAAKRPSIRKPAAKKSTRRPAAKKSTTRKTTGGKSTARRTTTRKTTARKSTRKTAARKTTARKTTGRRPVIHVTPTRDGGWRAERAGSNRAVAKSDRKPEVIRRARDVAKAQNGRLVIHKANGRIQEERTYGPDPGRSRG
ncbi:MAG: hemerythrin domain-containing protein [Actinomycetota bacterium]|nr:hemerythrin domain-containing protein [Actinomycetota bacterium]